MSLRAFQYLGYTDSPILDPFLKTFIDIVLYGFADGINNISTIAWQSLQKFRHACWLEHVGDDSSLVFFIANNSVHD